MKRQCRILRISAEHNTSVRITDDISLLNWFPHFGTVIKRTFAGEARMETYEDKIAETERLREKKKRVRIEKGAGDVPEELGEKDEQMAVRHADSTEAAKRLASGLANEQAL